MAAALIMAGGRSSRMRATKGPVHKALVPVLGMSLLERNLRALFGQGFLDVTVAVAADEPAIASYVESRGISLAQSCGATLRLFREQQPLGTIGAAGDFAKRGLSVLIINVDNLSAIDLRALVESHEKSDAALTVAVHVERFAIPYGEVRVVEGSIVEYREKPDRGLLISSGTYVLSPRACAAIEPNRPTGIPQLIETLRTADQRIAAFEHDAPWVDVNDAAGVERAESLIAAQPDAFAWDLRIV